MGGAQLFDEVPGLLRGCWRRNWIRYADGTVDDTSTVVWLQLESLVADLRVPADHAELADRGSLAGCSIDDLRRLATGESSSGLTLCSPVDVDDDGVRRATAEWPDCESGIAFQPVGAYPEPGLLEWSADGSVMIERAPSGAYVERWQRMPGTEAPLARRILTDGGELYLAGVCAVFVGDRPVPVPRQERLDVLVAEAGDDRATLEALVDCEFSLLQQRDGAYVVTASTHPWRIGEVIDVAV